MSEAFYRRVRLIGGLVFRVASCPRILHRERAALPGAYLLAGNHESAFDAPLLIAATPRVIHWVSIVEIFRSPLCGWFLREMLAAPLDRQRVDSKTVREVVRHLRAGKVVGLFPEAGVRLQGDSVLQGGAMDLGILRLAELGRAPILPCVIRGGRQFSRWTAWLPLFRTRYSIAFGEPITVHAGKDRLAVRAEALRRLECAFQQLDAELRTHGALEP